MKILFLGDFFYDYDHIREDIYELGEHFRQYDAVVLNLEAPLKSGKPLKKWINLHHNEKTLPEVLKILNVKVVSLANNHIFDWSEEGYYRTIELLDGLGIGYFGVQKKEEGWSPLSVEIAGVPFDFYGCGWKEEQVISLGKSNLFIKNTDLNNLPYPEVNQNRVSVVMPHWGYEYEFLPLPVFVEYARNLVDKGVDLVVGSHPHVIQPCEQYRGKHILYSLGNFYFGSRRQRFPLGLSDYSIGFSYAFDGFKNKTKAELLCFLYNRPKDETCMIEKADFVSNILVENIDSSLPLYNRRYTILRYGTKPSLKVGQRKLNSIKLKMGVLRRAREYVFSVIKRTVLKGAD